MSQSLSLSRAARLAGVSRGQLQKRIREMELETFEGALSIDNLLQAYPDIELDADPVFEKAQRIKSNARPKKRYTDNSTPEPEVLMSRLNDFRNVLARTKTSLNSMEALLKQVTGELQALRNMDDAQLRRGLEQLADLMQQSLDKSEAVTDRKAELFAKDAILRFIAVSVRVLPSKSEFFVEGRDTLLDAALKAGLHIDYGCASGNCGKCRVKVLKGRISPVREHDYVLSQSELEEGYCLACSNTAVTDILMEAREAIHPEDLPRQEIRCLVKGIKKIADELVMLSIQTPKTKTLRFMAGQTVLMTLENGENRRLAVASCPCDGRNLEFLCVRKTSDNFFDALEQYEAAQTVLIDGPSGGFLLDEASVDTSVFISVGEGFGPVKSLIEHAIAIDNAVGMYLYRADSLPHGSHIGNLCRSWDDALDNFVYNRLDGDASPQQVLDKINETAGKPRLHRFYIAAPLAWQEECCRLLADAGVEAERICTFADL